MAVRRPLSLPAPRRRRPARVHNLRDVFDAARWLVRSGSPWRYLPKDFPPGRWSISKPDAGSPPAASRPSSTTSCAILRFADGRGPEPTAAIFDSRTLQSTPESGGRAGYDGAKRKKGSKVHAAVDTLGHLLALHVTPADQQAPRPRRRAGRGGAGGDRRLRRVGLRRSGLHGAGRGDRRRRRGDRPGSRKAARGEARLRAAAAARVVERSFGGPRGSAVWPKTTSG